MLRFLDEEKSKILSPTLVRRVQMHPAGTSVKSDISFTMMAYGKFYFQSQINNQLISLKYTVQ